MKSRKMFERVFASLPEAVFIADPSTGRIIACNIAVEHLFGYSETEVLDRSPEFLYTDREIYEKSCRQAVDVLDGGNAFNSESLMKRKDGSLFPSEQTLTQICDEGGRRASLVLIVRDITERKRLADEIVKAKKLEATRVLTRGIAHDFNNLLTALLGNISLARIYSENRERLLKALDNAEKTVMAAADLTRQFQAFARGEAPVKKSVPAAQFIRSTIRYFLAGSRTQCVFHIPHGLRAVCVDEEQVRQVIGNVVANARESMENGGEIIVSAENVTRSSGEESSGHEGSFLRLSIKDHGPGISRETLPNIFDAYFTTKQQGAQKGLGLGLTLAYSVLKKHGGFIEVDSEPGRGTTVHLHLPAAAP